MIRARHVSLTLAAIVLVAVTVGTGGFSSATVERGTAIDVADDESAYVGVEITEDASVQSGNETTLLELTNRVGTPLTITATVSSNESDVTVLDETAPDPLSGGDTDSVTVNVGCTEETSAERVTTSMEVEIEASGPNVQIVMNRTVPAVQVNCTAENPSTALASAESVGDDSNTTGDETNVTDEEPITMTATPVNNISNATTSVMNVNDTATTPTDTPADQSTTA